MSSGASKKDSLIAHHIEKGSEAPQVAPQLLMECPAELGPVARQEWDRLLRDMPNSVKIENCDRGQLAIYCNSYARWLEAVEAIEKYGAVMKSPNGHPIQSPYVSIANQEAATMLRIANEFGFTPASRNRFPRHFYSDTLDLQPLKW